MKSIQLKISLHSFWHIGSGFGRGGYVDALVLRDRHGLPYLPGRSIKGLFRESGQIVVDNNPNDSNFNQDVLAKLFGKSGDDKIDECEKQGELAFDSAYLSEPENSYLCHQDNKELRDSLFDIIYATAIDQKTGTTVDHSLRAIEVTLPVELTGTVTGPDDTNWPEHLSKMCQFVRVLGAHRHRGLGRCSIQLVEG